MINLEIFIGGFVVVGLIILAFWWVYHPNTPEIDNNTLGVHTKKEPVKKEPQDTTTVDRMMRR